MKSVLRSDSGCADFEFLSGGKLFLRLENQRQFVHPGGKSGVVRILKDTGANEVSSASEAKGDYANADKPMPRYKG